MRGAQKWLLSLKPIFFKYYPNSKSGIKSWKTTGLQYNKSLAFTGTFLMLKLLSYKLLTESSRIVRTLLRNVDTLLFSKGMLPKKKGKKERHVKYLYKVGHLSAIIMTLIPTSSNLKCLSSSQAESQLCFWQTPLLKRPHARFSPLNHTLVQNISQTTGCNNTKNKYFAVVPHT